jgi:hypothetical protein
LKLILSNIYEKEQYKVNDLSFGQIGGAL